MIRPEPKQPSMADWNRTKPPDGTPQSDEGYAYEHFWNKSLDEARQLLEDNDLLYLEDFTYMPRVPFLYYLPTLVAYVCEEPRAEKSDGASCFLRLIETTMEDNPDWLDSVWGELQEVLEHLEASQEQYEAPPEIYGSFRVRVDSIFSLRDRYKQEQP